MAVFGIISTIFFVTLIKNIEAQSCGTPSVIGRGNVVGGSKITRGEFPWLVAIFRIQDDGEFSYTCGGNLISNKKVLTVAHCILNKYETRSLTPGKMLTILGGYDLNKALEPGRETVPIIKIEIHPDWHPFSNTFDGDLALLELDHAVTFNNFIKPICLWESSSDPLTSSGVVVGYGKSEDKSKIHENIPKKLQIPIHTQEKCFLTKPDLLKISSLRTLCAGAGNGNGVCVGDSGSGLYVKISNVYYLRAIVSSSLVSLDSCDVNSYAVFTNVWKFKTWIKAPTSVARNPFRAIDTKTIKTTQQTTRASTLRTNPFRKIAAKTIKTKVKTTKRKQQTTRAAILRTNSLRKTAAKTIKTTKRPQPTTRATTLRTIIRQTGFDECGVMSTASGLIQNGRLSSRTEFPWLASIVGKFHSSGPLVSRKHVISILSVVGDFSSGRYKPLTSFQNIKIYLGGVKYNDVSSPGAFMLKPQKVTFHPSHQQVDNLPVANFAILTLNALVPFSEIVRPVCLWSYTDDLKILKSTPKYGVGYGTNEKGQTSDLRKYVKLTLTDEQECKKEYGSKYSNFMKQTKTFCLKGSSSGNPCHGDESMYVKYGTKWYFRGFSAQRKSDDNFCKLSPILYEDISHHAKWIQDQIKV